MSSMTTGSDRAAQRRAARRADNRADILDAAERVFAAHGIQAGSIRKIGAESGFSAAAVYLFFDNKQQLLLETLSRRGDELVAAVGAAAATDGDALDALHRIVDVAVDYFENHPEFSRIVHQLRGGVSAGPALGEPADATGLIDQAASLVADLVRAGQAAGEIRPGDPRAIAHLYEVIVHEHVILAAAEDPHAANLTRSELHAFLDGALRAPAG
jgi:AcrR family transcriptional regulator